MMSRSYSTNAERTVKPDQQSGVPAWLALEGGLVDLVAWAGVLRDLGASDNQIDGSGLIVIAGALDTLAEAMQRHYDVVVGRAG